MDIRRAVTVAIVCLPAAAAAQDGGPSLTFGGVIDVRYAHTDDTRSWLDGGLGKLRYGPPLAGRADLFRISQLSLLVRGDITETLDLRVQLNADTETSRALDRARVDVIEAALRFHPDVDEHWRLRVRAGLFFPPVSIENDGPAWTSPYTLTLSAPASWVADEVRTTGVEAKVSYLAGAHELSLGGAGFGGGDPSGSILAWRGWALGDRQAAASDRLPLAPLPSIQAEGLFPLQADWVHPFREVDGRLGYYAAASWSRTGAFDVRLIHHDNRGRPTAFDGQQYAWKTRFTSAAARLELGRHLELLGQHLRGSLAMGEIPVTRLNPVANDFDATWGMVSLRAGRARLSVRYDDFAVDDNDPYRAEDDNRDDGSAWTVCAAFDTGEKHRLALEWVRLTSEHPYRARVGLPARAEETLLQASFRARF